MASMLMPLILIPMARINVSASLDINGIVPEQTVYASLWIRAIGSAIKNLAEALIPLQLMLTAPSNVNVEEGIFGIQAAHIAEK